MPVTSSGSKPKDNLLKGVYFCNPKRVSPYVGTPFDVSTMRTFGITKEGNIGFISTPDNLTTVEVSYVKRQCLPANSSYLSISDNTPAELLMLNQADYDAYVEAHTTHYATSISLSQTKATVTIGQEITLTATVLPENTTDKRVTWSSSDTSVATVSNGVVKALGVGKAVITATTADGTNLSATCNLTVEPIKATAITLSQTTATLYPGDELQLTATLSPADVTNKNVVWTSTDTNIATVSEGKVTAIAPGEVGITATTTDGTDLSATCTVTVKPILAQSITLDHTAENLTVGDRLQLTATILPANTTDKRVTWSSSAPSVAEVGNDGIIVVVGPGEATITATTNDGTNLTAQCEITATPATVIAESISLDITSGGLYIGRTLQLIATILPDDVSTHGVSWSTSNPSVATVNELGLVFGLTEGEVVITATTVDGSNLSASCTLTVSPVLAERITLNISTADVEIGSTLQLEAMIEPEDVTSTDVVWSTNNAELATVDEQGLVTVKAQGEVVITATTTDGTNISASCNIHCIPGSGIVLTDITNGEDAQFYTLDGRRISTLRKGLNIVRTAEGTVRTIRR